VSSPSSPEPARPSALASPKVQLAVVGGLAVVIVAMFVLLIATRGDGSGIGAAEKALGKRYLTPLDDAGLTTNTTTACHRPASSAEERWNLSTSVEVASPVDKVAAALKDAGVVVRNSGDQTLLQQTAGKPETGWNGGLRAAGDGTTLLLAWDNATPERATGWADVCAAEAG
jgi:hypothetical protein